MGFPRTRRLLGVFVPVNNNRVHREFQRATASSLF